MRRAGLLGLLLLVLARPLWAQALAVPQGLVVRPAPGVEGQTTLLLTWDPVPGAYGYEVLLWKEGRWVLDEEDTSLIPATASTRIGGLRPDTPYEFRVRATAGASRLSELGPAAGGRTLPLGATAPAPAPAPPRAPGQEGPAADVAGPPPEAPTGLLGLFADADTVQLAWRKVPGAASYRVEEERDGRWVERPGPSGPLRENRLLLAGHPRPGPYRFRIFAVGANGRMSEPSWTLTISRD